MRFRLSRLMSAASAGYGVFALLRPRHLGNALSDDPLRQPEYDALALAYGVRDLTVSSLGLLGRSPRTVTGAMVLRVLSDLTDAAVLSRKVTEPRVRAKVLGITLGWAALSAGALVLDRRRDTV